MSNIRKAAGLGAGALALVVAGALAPGAATAAGLIHSSDIATNTIRAQDISNTGAVASGEIVDGKVRLKDLSSEVTDQLNVPGPPGQNGKDGVSGYEVDGTYVNLPADGATHDITVQCADGKVAVGGGFSTEFPGNEQYTTVVASMPSDFTPIAGDPQDSVQAHAWTVRASNSSDHDYNIRPWIACVQLGG